MEYFQLQKAVFDYLWHKHQSDNSFTFTVRQKANKGAEKNYFIGTQKSSYFGFTCWDIPVSYPGSSADLTNFLFFKGDNVFGVKFQLQTTRSTPNLQLQGNLKFGEKLVSSLQQQGVIVELNTPEKKIFYLQVFPEQREVSTFDQLIQCFEELYAIVNPAINQCINEVKAELPDWEVRPIDSLRFDDLIKKMHQRIQKYSTATPAEIAVLPEEDEDLFPSIMPEEDIPLNQILYGPPGTGKTYHTVNKAVSIANPSFELEGKSRSEIKTEYDRLKAEMQIEFITFHQSMTYEDFIEGIKPLTPEEGDKFLKYEVQPGIFKIMTQRAGYTVNKSTARFSLEPRQFEQASFYKINLFNPAQPDKEEAYKYCLENNCVMTGWGDTMDFAGKTETDINQMVKDGSLLSEGAYILNTFIHLVKTGNYVLLAKEGKVLAIGMIVGDYYYNASGFPGYNHYRNVEWLVRNASIPALEIYSKTFSPKTIYRLDKEEIKKDFFVKSAVDIHPTEIRKNYVLIIDEINRGNVSAIFGELITLIEEDKRKGAPEALEVMLPYSKEKFSVPANLYLIGTMNTADRSVEALDTALRRRFVFEGMSPMPELLNSYKRLKDLWIKYKHTYADDREWIEAENSFADLFGMNFTNKEGYENLKPFEDNLDQDLANLDHINFMNVVSFDGLSIQDLLSFINIRLAALLSKDHTIGHAWLMDVFSISDLQSAFKNKILPLLQEYFYNNYEKIGLVLGSAFLEEKTAKGIFAKDFKGTNDLQSDYDDKVMYSLKDPLELTREDFIKIYA